MICTAGVVVDGDKEKAQFASTVMVLCACAPDVSNRCARKNPNAKQNLTGT